MNKKIIVSAVILVLSAVVLSGCSRFGKENSETQTSSAEEVTQSSAMMDTVSETENKDGNTETSPFVSENKETSSEKSSVSGTDDSGNTGTGNSEKSGNQSTAGQSGNNSSASDSEQSGNNSSVSGSEQSGNSSKPESSVSSEREIIPSDSGNDNGKTESSSGGYELPFIPNPGTSGQVSQSSVSSRSESSSESQDKHESSQTVEQDYSPDEYELPMIRN